jgi:hypothetical protein
LNELQRNRAQNIDAPSWLWKNIVELMASPKEHTLSIVDNMH